MLIEEQKAKEFLFKEAEEKKEYRTKIAIHEVLFSEREKIEKGLEEDENSEDLLEKEAMASMGGSNLKNSGANTRQNNQHRPSHYKEHVSRMGTGGAVSKTDYVEKAEIFKMSEINRATRSMLEYAIGDRLPSHKDRNGYTLDLDSLDASVDALTKKRFADNNIDSRNPEHQESSMRYLRHYAAMLGRMAGWWNKNYPQFPTKVAPEVVKAAPDNLTEFELRLILQHMVPLGAAEEIEGQITPDPNQPNLSQVPVESPVSPVPTQTMQEPIPRQRPKPMSDPMAVPINDPSARYIQKRDTKKRRLVRQQAGLGTIEERLQKSANKLDNCGEFIVADKIDLLLQKIHEGKDVRQTSPV